MEENFNKKTIIFVFILLILLFLYIYKGFVLNGDYYYDELEKYKKSINDYNTTNKFQFALKGNIIKENITRKKIPTELSMIDNNILDIKSIIQSLVESNNRINEYMNTKDKENKSDIKKELIDVKEDQKLLENKVDELNNYIEKLRKYF